MKNPMFYTFCIGIVSVCFFGYFIPKVIDACNALIRISRALPHALHMLHWILQYQRRALDSGRDEGMNEHDWIFSEAERKKPAESRAGAMRETELEPSWDAILSGSQKD